MSSNNSVTRHIAGLKKGEEAAVHSIAVRFWGELIRLADRKLKASPRTALCEEDVVQDVLFQFFEQVQDGRFPKLENRDDLRQVLSMLVDRRAKDQIKKLNSQKAGGGNVRTESVLYSANDSTGQFGLASIACSRPTPQMAAEYVEMMRLRLEMLKDDEQRQIAVLREQGDSNREIAHKLGLGLRTVERRRKDIETIWNARLNDEV